MLDRDTIRAANYVVNSTDRDEVDARFPDDNFVREFASYLIEGLSRAAHADILAARAKKLRGEEMNDTEQALAEADVDNITSSMMSSMFKLGLAVGNAAATEDLTAGREWVKENPWRGGDDLLSRISDALGVDIQIISVDAKGEATVVAGTSDLTDEEREEIRAEGERIAREGRSRVPEAVKRWGL